MSTSYQNLDVRVLGLENALMFLMKTLRIKEVIGSPLEQTPLVREMDMYSWYREKLSQGLLEASADTGAAIPADAEASSAVQEPVGAAEAEPGADPLVASADAS